LNGGAKSLPTFASHFSSIEF